MEERETVTRLDALGDVDRNESERAAPVPPARSSETTRALQLAGNESPHDEDAGDARHRGEGGEHPAHHRSPLLLGQERAGRQRDEEALGEELPEERRGGVRE